MLIHHFLEQNAEKYPYKDAAIHLGGKINYLELEKAANRLSNALIMWGIKPGDRVAVLLESSINYIIAYFAILKAGAVVVGLDTQSVPRNYRNVLSDCEVSGLIVGKNQAYIVKEIYKDIPSMKLVICDSSYDHLPSDLQTEFWLDIQLCPDNLYLRHDRIAQRRNINT